MSMITSSQVSPGTSIPCHSETVPNRHTSGSATKRLVRSDSCASPWHRMVIFGSCLRTCAAATSAAFCEANRPRVRPPAAQTSSAISVSAWGVMPSRRGFGSEVATYRIPCRG